MNVKFPLWDTNIKFPLAALSWGTEEMEALKAVLASGRLTMGEKVAKFEESLATYVDSKYAVMVNSGSSANLLMVAALFFTKQGKLKLEPGDEVIVPAVSWSTMYSPLLQYGLKLRFVDVNLNTLNLDLDQLENAISDETRLIFLVNLLGNPNDFDRIKQIIGSRHITLLEDNCESLGASYKGQKTGTFGLMGSFSTYVSHHISTIEGGLVVTDDEEFYHILLALRAHGWTRNLPKHNHVCIETSDDAFSESFRFVLPGYNVRPMELGGALGIEQVRKLPEFVRQRRANARLFQRAMANHPELFIQEEIGESSWFGFSLVIRPESTINRKQLLAEMKREGFECRPIVAGNVTQSEMMKYFTWEAPFGLSNAEYIDQNGLFVGNQNYPIPDMVEVLGQLFR